MKRLFLDANILFTASHNPDGKSAFIISLSNEGAWESFASRLSIEEAWRNLADKYPEALPELDRLLKSVTTVQEDPTAPFPDGLEEKDRPIFQAAYSCRASYLITGDITHFGQYMSDEALTYGVIIATPSLFLGSL